MRKVVLRPGNENKFPEYHVHIENQCKDGETFHVHQPLFLNSIVQKEVHGGYHQKERSQHVSLVFAHLQVRIIKYWVEVCIQAPY